MMRRVAVILGLSPVLLAAYWFAGRAAMIDLTQSSAAPSPSAWLGTDALGRDLLARTIVAAPLSIALAMVAVTVALVVGVPLGAVSALGGLRARSISARTIEIVMSFPSLLLALVIVMLLGPGGGSAAVAVGLALAPGFARTAQSLAITVRESEYLAAALVLGLTARRRLVRYVLPNIAGPLAIKAAYEAGAALVIIAGFSFLGFGVQAPSYDWGRMLAQGLKSLYVTPLPALVPGIAITLAGVGFSLLSDQLLGKPHRRQLAGQKEGARATTDRSDVNGGIALSVRALHVSFGDTPILCGIDLDIMEGEALGLVGESGSGKTTLALAVAGLLPERAILRADRLALAGTAIHPLAHGGRSPLLGQQTGFVFQDALSALNPLVSIGRQIAERLEVYRGASRREAWAQSVAALETVGIDRPALRATQRSHQLSGGMRQRALLAMGLITRPALLIADEPTTALDVTIQAQVIAVIQAAACKTNTAILFVSHDLAVVAQLCSRIAVLYAGRIVEVISSDALAAGEAAHPYTRALVACLPGEHPGERLATIKGTASQPAPNEHGCVFAPRCEAVQPICRVEQPLLSADEEGQAVACLFPVTML